MKSNLGAETSQTIWGELCCTFQFKSNPIFGCSPAQGLLQLCNLWSAGDGISWVPCLWGSKLREGPTAKPAHCTLHSFARVLLNSESELSPTLHWKLFEGENQTFISVRVPQGRTASLGWFLYVFLPHMIILWPSGYFVSLWSHTPCGTGVHRNIPYQNKLQRNCFLAQKLETLKAEFQHASLSKGISRRS